MSQNPQLTLSEAVPVINDWKGGVGLIFEMEMAMKSRGLLPSSDNPQNTNFLKFEWQFFWDYSKQGMCVILLCIFCLYQLVTSCSLDTWRKVYIKGLPKSSSQSQWANTTLHHRIPISTISTQTRIWHIKVN